MEQQRFNSFHKIHQALRAMMYHVSITVQHTDFTNEEDVKNTLSLTEDMVGFFEMHAHTEDTLVFPMLANIAPDLIADFEQQHEKDHALGEALINAIQECRRVASPVEQVQSGQGLQRAIGEFVAFNLSHMNQEETRVLPVIWEHFSDGDLYAKEAEIVSLLTPEHKTFSGYWMLKGLATHEIISWFNAIRANAPSDVFDQYIMLAEKALTADQFNAVQKGLALSLV